MKDQELYDGCGNRLLLVRVEEFSYDDLNLRKELQRTGLEANCDSVMVLTGNPEEYEEQGYHLTMDVFEPRGEDGLVGSWSTMCGNGVRAVAAYLREFYFPEENKFIIKTRSGLNRVNVIGEEYEVSMGEFTSDYEDLRNYISDNNFSEKLNISCHDVIAGLNGIRGNSIDGEPHLLLFFEDKELDELMKIANKEGLEITTNEKIFPKHINSNFVSVRRISKAIEVDACTFERGVNGITQACGTGATAIGSYLLINDPEAKEVIVRMPGGTLVIRRNENGFSMIGPAIRVLLAAISSPDEYSQ